MNMFRALAVFLLGPVAAMSAQDQATTLLSACRSADVIVSATVAQATDPSPDWHRLQFTTDLQLKGANLPTFTLLEPSGPCCGRSLFALQVGERRLFFLRRIGAALHPVGGARGVLPVVPEVVHHVQALLTAPDEATVARLLARSLAAGESRIADDAALALAALSQFSLPASERALVVTALQTAAAQHSTRTAALVEVAVRHPDATMLDTLLPTYLSTKADGQARLMRRALARCTAATVIERLPLHLGDHDDAMLRAAELLSTLPIAEARAPLEQLLRRTNCPRVQLCASEGLLAGGTAAATLANSVPEPVLDLANRRQVGRRPFRAIDPYRK